MVGLYRRERDVCVGTWSGALLPIGQFHSIIYSFVARCCLRQWCYNSSTVLILKLVCGIMV